MSAEGPDIASTARPRPRDLAAYAALGLPLAMVGLPIYVHLPKLYAQLGLSLTWLGVLLLLLRVGDALIDPWLGRLSDRAASRRRFIAWGALPLSVGLLLVFAAPALTTHAAALQWAFAGALVLVYLGFSAVTVSYHAWGGEWPANTHDRTRITVAREAAGLVGVLIASALPVVLTLRWGDQAGFALFGLALVASLLLFGITTLRLAPAFRPSGAAEIVASSLWQPLRVEGFRRLLSVYGINGVASAIPATLFLFFVQDVVRAESKWQAILLFAYFLSGAAATPAWMALSRRVGKRRAWAFAMVLACCTFVWASTLGAGDTAAFLIVCVLSGLALGADLTLPPSMLADQLAKHPTLAAGASFGVWTMVSKASLALAAGLALPLLAGWGYTPNAPTPQGIAALTVAYALFPCAIKLAALAALLYFLDDEPT